MELIEVIYRNRNDFHWIGRCRHCGHEKTYSDGYADAFYCEKVVPARRCPVCRKDCLGNSDVVREEGNE